MKKRDIKNTIDAFGTTTQISQTMYKKKLMEQKHKNFQEHGKYPSIQLQACLTCLQSVCREKPEP